MCVSVCLYRAFHEFGQAKIPYGGLVLGSSQFSLLSCCLKKNDTLFKSGQILTQK